MEVKRRYVQMIAITHIGLAVPDLDQGIRWYEEVLGFEKIAGPYSFNQAEEKEHNMTNDLQGQEVRKMRNAHLTCGNQVGLELFEFEEPRREQPPKGKYNGFFHLCLLVDDIETVANRIETSGGKKTSEKWNTRDDKPYYLQYCEDPFGNIIELYNKSTEIMYGNKEN